MKRARSIGITIGAVALGMGGVAFGLDQLGSGDGGEAQGAAPTGDATAVAVDAASGGSGASAATTAGAAPTTVVIDLPADQGGPGAADDDHGNDDHGDDRHGGGHHGKGRDGGRGGLDAISSQLGMTPDELRTAIEGGETIATIATAKGIDPQTIIDAAYQAWLDREQAEVASGDHTQAEVDERAAEVKDRITAMVNGTFTPDDHGDGDGPHGDGSHGKGKGDHGRGDHHGPGDDGAPDDTAAA